ncbi:hypothetical protein FC27_GL000625 [Companilactobacillus versmoldensis DSM 14857 = KCTC 3814]|uniref:Thoeris anti-defense 2-like domain-containing protein n=2 Tax=Companilactobacillus versmoldensis TaxID=194326 RepID=A0A0R1SIQ6_9LACO|nr:hypothetical protein FC27_GL000625 [Companilactobacillus versmoldensis DSM 14857 = KCTC 3814]
MEDIMTFEAILPHLKQGEKAVRTGWEGTELFVVLQSEDKFDGDVLNPYFLIKTADEAYSMWSPTDCDILATDWELVNK